ncbi:nucleotidyltransferase domain-containing protein [uncultured Tessaracoccus sp.]|uniref:nucleotidyltransferase domain-containing protein n=1 Tax=uncultured Tessaracoccus sp. TaxID=905023 RepID=UPI00345CED46
MRADPRAYRTPCRRSVPWRGELAHFGSVVTGDFGADSDVDFLVDFLPTGRIRSKTLVCFVTISRRSFNATSISS